MKNASVTGVTESPWWCHIAEEGHAHVCVAGERSQKRVIEE
jgi:hypothetical protein